MHRRGGGGREGGGGGEERGELFELLPVARQPPRQLLPQVGVEAPLEESPAAPLPASTTAAVGGGRLNKAEKVLGAHQLPQEATRLLGLRIDESLELRVQQLGGGGAVAVGLAVAAAAVTIAAAAVTFAIVIRVCFAHGDGAWQRE